jgi:hypothetical protein
MLLAMAYHVHHDKYQTKLANSGGREHVEGTRAAADLLGYPSVGLRSVKI